MSEMKYDRSDRLFIEGFEKFFTLSPETITPDEIKNLNNMTIPRGMKNRYLVHTSRSITVTTYIIPVSDGKTVISYFIFDRKMAEKEPLPLVIFFHGGGYIHANMDFYLTYLKYFAERMECAVLLVDYRLAPVYRFPTANEDCYDAVLWALEGIKYWKTDPDRVYFAGDGVGATLAITTTMLLRDRKGPVPEGNILLYPMTDCRLRTQSMETFKETPVLTQRMLSFYIKNYSREPKDSLSPLMSPLLAPDLTRMSPTLIIAAGTDPLLDDAVLYGEKLAESGVKKKVLISENSMHGFLPFKYAKGREEAETAIWQMINGRNVESIEFMKKDIFSALKKKR